MSSVDFITTFDFSASGFPAELGMPKFDALSECLGVEVEDQNSLEGCQRTFQYLNEQEINWVNSIFQAQPPPIVDQPQPKSPQPSYDAPIQGDFLYYSKNTLQLPQIQSHSIFLNPALPSVVSMKKECVSETSGPIDLVIQSQPPIRVRTRTPNEIRTFSVAAGVTGSWRSFGAHSVKVSLAYASLVPSGRVEAVSKDILGGTKVMAIKEDGTVKFSNLSVSESSTKHHEKEFCLHLTILGSDGMELFHKLSEPFYAYSHKKVLQRRESMKLRELSKPSSSFSGGEIIHLVGFPFKQGPDFEVIFRTPYGDVAATNYEFFSESVLYFKVPRAPCCEAGMEGKQMRVSVVATNDGKVYSNALEFTYMF